MPTRRRHRGFERAGHVPAGTLGLSLARSRELALAGAWVRVAGETLARHATPLRVRGGVLEIRVEDERWLPPLRALIPRLAGRLAAEYPGFGVRKFRLRRCQGGDEPPAEVEPWVREASGGAEAGIDPRPPHAEAAEPTRAVPSGERLERAMERYLGRVNDQTP